MNYTSWEAVVCSEVVQCSGQEKGAEDFDFPCQNLKVPLIKNSLFKTLIHYYGVCSIYIWYLSFFTNESWCPIYCNIPEPHDSDKTADITSGTSVSFYKERTIKFFTAQLETLFKLLFLAFTKILLKQNLHNT